MKPRARLLGLGASPFALDPAAAPKHTPQQQHDTSSSSSLHAKVEEAKQKSSSKDTHTDKRRRIRWLKPGLMVRFLLPKGSLKCIVREVFSHTCTLTAAAAAAGPREYIEDVCEQDCETIVPQAGGRVLVLCGEDTGSRGRLVHRDKQKERVGVLLDEDDGRVVTLSFDDVCMEASLD